MSEDAVERFRALLRVPTVSHRDVARTDWDAFDRFAELLRNLYPLTHRSLERELVDGHSLLYRWVGRKAADPTVLMAHFDVVAAPEEGWRHRPFAADLVDARLHGRGTIDDKGALVAILEAVERLLAEGFTPAADVYLSFGHDEETWGSGARSIVALLESRGVTPGLVLDEGGAIVEGVFPGVHRQIAVIGVSEKGIVNLQLAVAEAGGHASTPPRLSATARLARAILRLDSRPFPARLSPATRGFIRTVGAESTPLFRAIFTRLRVTEPLVVALFARLGAETAAMVRTTQAVTQLTGSAGANVLAEEATAVVNLRVAVGSSVSEAVEHVRRSIRDPMVRIVTQDRSEPSPISPSSGTAWNDVVQSVSAVHPTAIVAPYVMLAASDSRHFSRISRFVYRFSPFELSSADRAALHARNESIDVSTWLRGISVYEQLLRRR